MSYFIGLDLGGTAVKGGLIDAKGKVVGEIIEIKLAKPISTENVIDTLVQTAKLAISKAQKTLDDVISIGIGSPGLLDYEKGIVKKAANFPGFENVPIVERVSKLLGNKPAILECDATAAAAAELWVGAGAKSDIKSLVLITLGTGIGSGIVIDRQIVHGVGMAGEIGHTVVETDPTKAVSCGCGAKGCLERYASASSMELRTKEGLKTYKEATSLRDLKEIKCPDIFKAAKNGDKYAQSCVNEVAKYLGQAIVNLCRVVDPQLIVLAGGLSKAGAPLLDKIGEYYKKFNWTLDHPTVTIVQTAVDKESAGVVGAAYAAKLLVEKRGKSRL